MTTKSKYAEWKKKWRARPFEDGYVETKAFLTQHDHERIVEIAKEVGDRIPMLMGQMIGSYLSTIDGKTSKLKTPELKVEGIEPTEADMDLLCSMVLRSRFEGDTGAARLRQMAFISTVNAELVSGNRPIARTIALSTGSHPSQIEALAKIMEARGVIRRIALHGVNHSRFGKVLTIRDDAIKAFNEVHVRDMGTSLIEPSTDA